MGKAVVVVVAAFAALAALAGASTALAARGGSHSAPDRKAAHGRNAASTCDGELKAGNYRKLVVPAGATCDGRAVTDVVSVRGGVRIGPNATFILGTEESGKTVGRIRGGLRAKSPASVQLHFAHVGGGVRISGGNGFANQEEPFTSVEDNVIRGGVRIVGYSGLWFGFIRNHVRGTVKLTDNVLVLDDANEFVTNTIKGNLVCYRNVPAPHVGDSEGQPNVVTGRAVGQCAPPLPNP